MSKYRFIIRLNQSRGPHYRSNFRVGQKTKGSHIMLFLLLVRLGLRSARITHDIEIRG